MPKSSLHIFIYVSLSYFRQKSNHTHFFLKKAALFGDLPVDIHPLLIQEMSGL